MFNLIYKTAEKKSFNEKTGEIEGWASRGDIIDRDGEIILSSCWQDPESTREFMLNPILCAFHQYNQLGLGRVVELQATKEGLKFKAVFADTAAAQEARAFIQSTGLAAFSCGFLPVSFRDLRLKEVEAMGFDISGVTADKVRCYDAVRLIEISLCSIPACQTALSAAFESGQVKQKDLLHALTQWKKETDLQTYVRRIVESSQFQNYIRDKIKEELQKKVREKERADFISKEVIKEIQLGLLKKRGIVVAEDEVDAMIEKYWPSGKGESGLISNSAIGEIAGKLADLMKK